MMASWRKLGEKGWVSGLTVETTNQLSVRCTVHQEEASHCGCCCEDWEGGKRWAEGGREGGSDAESGKGATEDMRRREEGMRRREGGMSRRVGGERRDAEEEEGGRRRDGGKG